MYKGSRSGGYESNLGAGVVTVQPSVHPWLVIRYLGIALNLQVDRAQTGAGHRGGARALSQDRGRNEEEARPARLVQAGLAQPPNLGALKLNKRADSSSSGLAERAGAAKTGFGSLVRGDPVEMPIARKLASVVTARVPGLQA